MSVRRLLDNLDPSYTLTIFRGDDGVFGVTVTINPGDEPEVFGQWFDVEFEYAYTRALEVALEKLHG